MYKMRGTRALLLLIISSSLLMQGLGADPESQEKKAVGDSEFNKRQGLVIQDGEDQIAMESNIDQIAVESNHAPQQQQQFHHQQPPMAFPIPVRGVPGNIVFPMPPGGMRVPPPAGFVNKQHQQQHGFIHKQPTPHPQILSTPAGDVVIQRATEFSITGNGNGRGQGLGQHHQPQVNDRRPHPQILPPHPHPQQQQHHQQINQNRQPQHQQQQRPQSLSSAEITKNIIRQLFERKPEQGGNGNGNGNTAPRVLNRPQEMLISRPIPTSGVFGKEVALSTNDLNAEGAGEVGRVDYGVPSRPLFGSQESVEGSWPVGPDADTPKITSLEVKCEKNVMRVFISFDKPFNGVIFSKGHYNDMNCIHLPAGLGHTSANFDISINTCGTQGSSERTGYAPQEGGGSFFENVVVIQYDSQVQEVWDQARKLRCTWHDQYEKSVTFRPFPVDSLDVVRADFAGDNVGCWMQIQTGKGPWASEVSGLVKIGQTMTMVLAIKDDDNKFDMMVRNCVAHDGVRAPIQLVDQWGCITKPKLMSPFKKIKNFGASATVLSYAHFQAFKFPDSVEVHFQCTIQICRHQCPEQCSSVGRSGLLGDDDKDSEGSLARRKRRSASEDEIFEYQTTFKVPVGQDDVGLNKVITVVSPDDLDFPTDSRTEDALDVIIEGESDVICMSTIGFAVLVTLLISLLLLACTVSAVAILRRRKRF